MTETSCCLESLKYFLSDASQEKAANPWIRETHNFQRLEESELQKCQLSSN